jgi:DNA polymerase
METMVNGTSRSRSKTVRAAAQQLADLGRAGITHLPKPRGDQRRGGPAAAEDGAGPPAVPEVPPASAASPRTAEERAAALLKVAQRVSRCTRCRTLAETRTQTVFGSGNPCARLVFMGEAPGADEDRQGKPFVGRAGQLLTDIIVKGMKLRREDVYILNTLKCRPPGNRTPQPDEMANCREYLDEQLAILRPEFICCLGAVAAHALLDTEESIGRLRGRVHQYQGFRVVCTYHPAYLLRNPDAKRFTWQDIQFLMAEMGMRPAEKG